jgi:hypothetical protein
MPQGTVNLPVASFVRCYLGVPVATVSLRHSAMPGAAVPEAAVHKHCELLFSEHEVRIARQRSMPTPTAYFLLAQQPHEDEFGNFVAAAPHGPHDFRALLF